MDEVEQLMLAERERRPLEEDDCATDVCKALAALGFEGLADETESDSNEDEVPDEPSAAWRRQLDREGKRNPAGKSLKDLIVDASHQR